MSGSFLRKYDITLHSLILKGKRLSIDQKFIELKFLCTLVQSWNEFISQNIFKSSAYRRNLISYLVAMSLINIANIRGPKIEPLETADVWAKLEGPMAMTLNKLDSTSQVRPMFSSLLNCNQ